jgi:methylenetetrahydrofolate reductase (NADPH)
MNQGTYLEDLLDAEPSDFCVGVAGYPEKHFEAPNLKVDIRFTREKVDAGAEYIVTQMVFDNRRYFEYLDACRAAEIQVPVIPGIKVLTRKRHINSIPRTFHVGIPTELADPVLDAKTDDEVLEIGIGWATRQAEELLNANVPAIHFYVMQNANAVRRVLQTVQP